MRDVDIVFSAVESEAARVLEPQYAKTAAALSTASAFRYEDDVPILVPGVNLAHAAWTDEQRRRRGWQGFIAPLPNCTTMGLVVTLKPLLDRFGVQRVVMTSMQGVSVAGLSPGVAALEILDNIIPFIPGEEEKVARETGKILDATFPVIATCTREAVTEGHTEAVTVSLGRAATPDDVAAAFRRFGVEFTALGLPSAPQRMITVHDDPYRPQPRLDRDADGGMTTRQWLLSLVVSVAVVLTAAVAGAQAPAPPEYGAPISLEQAKKTMAGAEAEANKNKWPVVITILDSGGQTVMVHRLDNAQWGSVDIAKEKARAAVALRRPTKALQDAVAQGGVNLRLLNLGYSVLEGGIPIVVGGKVIGSIGVSGVTSQQDAQVGQAGIDALK